MNARPTLILVLLATLACTATWWALRADQHQGPLLAQRRTLLSAAQLPIDKINRITLTRGSSASLIFDRNQARWNQVQPIPHPMDPWSIQQLIEQASRLEVIDRIDPAKLASEVTPAVLGLNPPLAQLTFDWPGGNLRLTLGKLSIGGRAYLQIDNDSTVYVVNQSLHERAITADPLEWRDRSIFHEVGIDSARIERIDNDRRMTLVRQRKTWSMIEPVQTRLDTSARDTFMQELGRARVGGFILDLPPGTDNTAMLARFGLDHPIAQLAIINATASATTSTAPTDTNIAAATSSAPSDAGQVQRLFIGSAVGIGSQDRFGLVDGRPVVVKIPALTLGLLFRAPENLAAATGSGVQAADVKSIVIRTSDSNRVFKLQRELERWLVPDQATPHEIPPAYVEELLNQLTALKAPHVEFRDYPRDAERATVTLHGYDGKALDTVRIARSADGQNIVLENGDNVLRIFPASLKIRLSPADFGLSETGN